MFNMPNPSSSIKERLVECSFMPLDQANNFDFSSMTSNCLVFALNSKLECGPALTRLDKDGIIARWLADAKERKAFEGKAGQCATLTIPGHGPAILTVILVGIGCHKEVSAVTMQNVGGHLATRIESLKIKEADIFLEDSIFSSEANSLEAGHGPSKERPMLAASLALGINLRLYTFTAHYVAKLHKHKIYLKSIQIYTPHYQEAYSSFERLSANVESVYEVRDLVNEAPNILYPESFASYCRQLSNLGVNVHILDEEKMHDLGMYAILGVGQGSINPPRLAVLHWVGDEENSDQVQVGLVGKGITFDTGGINLKTHVSIYDMKDDMAGAAAVYGTIAALAKRKAKVNVVGILAMAENMPGGKAQRPSDVVTSMSGQTIEVLDTDAEGRLVLADALWYVQERYNPPVVIDIATLTGAAVVAVSDAYACLFSNDDELAKQLLCSGKSADEPLWRLPMGPEFDERINSDIADVCNIERSGRGGGSSIGAQFLFRFIRDDASKPISASDEECPDNSSREANNNAMCDKDDKDKNNQKAPKRRWAHLDIGPTALIKRDRAISPKGATGYGVRLLEEFIYKYHEKK